MPPSAPPPTPSTPPAVPLVSDAELRAVQRELRRRADAPRPRASIVLSRDEARAALRGKLRHVIRPIRPQPPSLAACEPGSQFYSLHPVESSPGTFDVHGSVGFVRATMGRSSWACPYGRPGSAHAALSPPLGGPGRYLPARAHAVPLLTTGDTPRPIEVAIEGVRVMRVRDITEHEMLLATGISTWTKDGTILKFGACDDEGDGPLAPWRDCPRTPVAAFEAIIRARFGAATWGDNHLVWVLDVRTHIGGTGRDMVPR